MELNAQNLITYLARNGIVASVECVNVGPIITQYCIKLDDWALLNKIEKMFADDKVRVTMLPTKELLGLEFMNKTKQTIELAHLLQNPAFVNSTHKIPMAVGVNVAGNPIYYDLTKMPHMLITGRTGSGKTMFLQSILASIKTKFSPTECKFIIIDTKGVEFDNWDNSPYLIKPIIKLDPEESMNALQWAVNEMDKRYQQMRQTKTRNVAEYNARVDKKSAMPYIVIIIDEFADLMSTDGKNVETYIQRIAQKARGAGIHLIMATQRPENNVLTDIIKANIPTRIAFRARNKRESLKTLGECGAENLTCCGDMLFSEAGREPVRIHTPYIKYN